MPKRGIPTHSVGRIFTRKGNLRVSNGSKQVLKEQLELWTTQIAERALVYMRHAKRKTVMPDDIRLAIMDVFKEQFP
ncbi:histone [Candidatus Woesearchaeota archaeon]|nr:NFYB/HAP3 family transcription factor subunit [Candidatus Woesearchaeota archaeon]RLE41848.1 MAG: histone [Candidatus Woesearchaeota archaeon]